MNSVTRVLETPELISFIFVLLKAEKEKWKGHAASLAIVNRFFFYASIGVVWEEMYSFEPFCTILVPSKVASAPTRFSEDTWGRFNLYSIKTKTLVLNGPSSLLNNPNWACALVTASNPTKGRLFPSLKAIHLNSADPLSLYITSSTCPHIKGISVCIAPTSPEIDEAIQTLTLTLSRQARSLVAAQLSHSFTRHSLRNVVSITTLQGIVVWMAATDHSLVTPSLWAPSSVAVIQKPQGPLSDRSYGIVRDHSFKFMREARLCEATNRAPLPRTLRVVGTSEIHHMLAQHPCAPAPSQRFSGICLWVVAGGSGLMIADPLNTATIASYMSRNPGLTALKVYGQTRALHAQTVARTRANPVFRDINSLLDQLSALRNLTIVVIERIYFPSGDTTLQMLNILQGSPNLAVFRFLPLPLSGSSADALAVPSMACLGGISNQCPKLTDFAIPVDLVEIGVLNSPENTPLATSKLRRLFLPRLYGDFPSYTVEDRGRVAEYLYRLFPNLVPMASQWKEPSVGRAFWKEIDDIYLKLGANRE